MGAPADDGDHGTPANLSGPLVPNRRASSRCPSASTLAQKNPAAAMRGHVADDRPGQDTTSGGSSDSAANDWHAKPASPPASTVVIT